MVRDGKLLKIDAGDNVAVALEDIAAGETLESGHIVLTAKEDYRQRPQDCPQ